PLRMLNSPVPREIDRRAPAMKNRFQPAPRRSASKLSLSSTASQSRQYSVVLTWSPGGSSVPLRIRIVPAITFCRDCFISGSQRLSSLAPVGFHYYWERVAGFFKNSVADVTSNSPGKSNWRVNHLYL